MTDVTEAALLGGPGVLEDRTSPAADAARRDGAARVRAVVQAHYGSLWRLLRRLGVPEGSVEDAAQQVLWVFARRVDDVDPGRERTFLFGVALRVALSVRRQQRRWREVDDERSIAELAAPGPDAAQDLDDRRARAVLDRLLASMPLELRAVFVLYELEEMTMAEIASTLEIPPGTVASRLRRARDAFQALSRRIQARGTPRPPSARGQ
jgi:RNA polymerase sigma-70 factor (ECF subfamily)